MSMLLAGAGSTNSRGKRPLPPGAVSARTLSGHGVTEWTEFTYANGSAQRRSLLSWVGGQAGLLFAHGPYPEEIEQARRNGQVPGSYGHAAEYALAEALGQALDGLFTTPDLACRFFQDGGTALNTAARLARHATGREYVASCGYHGAGAEWVHLPNDKGIPWDFIAMHTQFEWGDVDTMRALAAGSAAICVEVPPVPDDEAAAFLAACRQACDEGGAVFILDEVVTGFRGSLRGMAGQTGVKPDIACYGKAIASRGRLSAIVGRRDLVESVGGEVFSSTTFGGHPEACADGAATLRYLMANEELYEQMNMVGSELQAGFNALGLNCVGQPTRSVCVFPSNDEWLAWSSAMIERGVVCHRPQFVSIHHDYHDVRHTLEVAADVLCPTVAR